MKKLAYIFITLIMAAGCGEKPAPVVPDTPDKPDVPVTPVDPPAEEETLAEKIAGEWHCVVSGMDADIYLSLTSDNGFELYQKVGEGSHRLYRGTWTLDEKTRILDGRYNDGSSWGSSYETAVSEDGNSMTLVPKKAAQKEEHVYRRGTIPSEVKDGCVVIVKSSASTAPAL
jgi:hypothetical protein